MDLKLRIIGYDALSTNAADVEAAVNAFMAQVIVDKVEVAVFASRVVLHIFYRGEVTKDDE